VASFDGYMPFPGSLSLMVSYIYLVTYLVFVFLLLLVCLGNWNFCFLLVYCCIQTRGLCRLDRGMSLEENVIICVFSMKCERCEFYTRHTSYNTMHGERPCNASRHNASTCQRWRVIWRHQRLLSRMRFTVKYNRETAHLVCPVIRDWPPARRPTYQPGAMRCVSSVVA